MQPPSHQSASPDGSAAVEDLGEAAATVTRSLRGRPALAMPETVWHRLEAALTLEAANRNTAVELDRPDPVDSPLEKDLPQPAPLAAPEPVTAPEPCSPTSVDT